MFSRFSAELKREKVQLEYVDQAFRTQYLNQQPLIHIYVNFQSTLDKYKN